MTIKKLNENNSEADLDPRKLRIGLEALKVCNEIHEQTNKEKIPLSEVADHLGIDKAEIQDAFDELVKTGEIGDDGDRDYMNYHDAGVSIETIERLLMEKMPIEEDIEEDDYEELDQLNEEEEYEKEEYEDEEVEEEEEFEDEEKLEYFT